MSKESDLASGYPRFSQRFPWYGGDLQTVRNYLVPGIADLSPWPEQRLEIETRDYRRDRLLAAFHSPSPRTDISRPTALLIHGLTGCEGSFYVLETARFLLASGHPVVRANLRGSGPSRATCAGHYCAGSSDDIATLLARLPEAATRNGLVLVGYSLGGNMVLKYLAEAGSEAGVEGAVTISAPIRLGAAARRMMAPRNRLYHRWLLARMKEEALGGAADVTDREREAIAGARTVYEYDDRFIAPRFGFDGAEDYYARCSAAAMLGAIRVPALLIHARNDPWIPADGYEVAAPADGSPVQTLLAGGGGHVGFHGRDRETPWHNQCLRAFIDRRIGARSREEKHGLA